MTLPGALSNPRPPADMLAALANPDVEAIFLAEITCGRFEPVWNSYGMDNTYYVYQGDQVVDVKLNGVSLTPRADLADVLANPGSWYWLKAAALCYVQLPLGADPGASGNTVETYLKYRFADTPQDLGGYFWQPRLADAPSLKWSIPDNFNGIGQIGGGTLTFNNTDHFFDSQFNTFGGRAVPGRLRQNWDAGQTVIYMGVAGFTFDQFLKVGTLSNAQNAFDRSTAKLDLKEAKIDIDIPYPFNTYSATDYPAIRQNDIGRSLQIAFGRILGVNPVCVNTLTCEFRVAAHPIRSFDGVRVKDSSAGTWNTVNFKTVDEMNARFTLDPADWADGTDLVVDFSGWMRDDGSLMDNPAEIIQAWLTDMGQPLNADAFETARQWYDVGYYGTDTTNRISTSAPSLYLDTQDSALTRMEAVMQQVRAYLLTDELGQFSMQPFRLYQGADLELVLDDRDLLSPGLTRQTNTADTANKPSKAVVNYAIRRDEGSQSVLTYEVPQQQYTSNNAAPIITSVGGILTTTDDDSSADTFFTTQADAQNLAECLVNEFSADPATYTGQLKWRPFAWRVAKHIHLISERHGSDVVLEIIDLELNLKSRLCNVTVGNLRGFEESAGFWVDDADTTPSGADLAWPSGGQVPGDECQYRRHQAGYSHDDKDNASATPLTAFDHFVSKVS